MENEQVKSWLCNSRGKVEHGVGKPAILVAPSGSLESEWGKWDYPKGRVSEESTMVLRDEKQSVEQSFKELEQNQESDAREAKKLASKAKHSFLYFEG